MMGEYQLYMETVEEEEKNEEENSTKRSLEDVFDKVKGSDGSPRIKKAKKDEVIVQMKKCLMFDGHPIFDIFEFEQTISDMQMANSYYIKIMLFINDVIKNAIITNEIAYPLYSKFEDDETKIF